MSMHEAAWPKTALAGMRTMLAAGLLATASMGAAQAAHKVGWVFGNDATNPSYTPLAAYTLNSAGGAVGITRSSTGVYHVTFSGLGSDLRTNALVNAFSTGGTCKVAEWSAGSAVIDVLCFDAAGAAADNQFTLLFQAHSGKFGSADKGMAFLWANDPTSASYTPDPAYQYNSTGSSNSITRSGPGAYQALLPGLTRIGGTVQVSAYGSGAGRCKVTGWSPDSDGQHVGVQCYDAAGHAADQQFTLAFVRGVPIAYLPNKVLGVYGWFNKAKGHGYKLSKAYQFNNQTSGALVGDRQYKGVSEVTYPDFGDFDVSNMLVTAYGDDNSYCNPFGWPPLDTLCLAQGGAAKDSQYTVAFSVTPP